MIQYQLFLLLINSIIVYHLVFFITNIIRPRIFKKGLALLLYSLLAYFLYVGYINGKEINYYQRVGLPQNFTIQQMRKIYRQHMKNNHPDQIKDEQLKAIAQQNYIEIHHIFDIIGNQELKQIYDTYGQVWEEKNKKVDDPEHQDKAEKQQAEMKEQFIQKKTFMKQTDLYIYYSFLTVFLLVFTQENSHKQMRLPTLLLLGGAFFIDYSYTFNLGEYTQYIENLNLFPDNLINQEKQELLRLTIPILFNLMRTLVFVGKYNNFDKIINKSKQIKEYLKKNIKEKNTEEIKSQLSELNQIYTNTPQIHNQQKKSKGKKVLKNVLQYFIIAIPAYYIIQSYFGDQNTQQQQQSE